MRTGYKHQSSNKSAAGLGAVVVLHLGAIWLLNSGMSHKIVDSVKKTVEVRLIEPPKLIEPPPRRRRPRRRPNVSRRLPNGTAAAKKDAGTATQTNRATAAGVCTEGGSAGSRAGAARGCNHTRAATAACQGRACSGARSAACTSAGEGGSPGCDPVERQL